MVKIVGDTTSSLPVQTAQKLGIPYLPQIINFGDQSYRDDCEMDSTMFLKKLRTSPVMPKTAAPPPALYTPIYKQLLDEGHTVLVLAPSAKVSGTFRSAQVAAQDFPGADIHVIDTNIVAGGLGELLIMANDWANEGQDVETIIARVMNYAARDRIYFVVDTLEFLFKGGRIGGAKALFGSVLQVKPILTLRNGQVDSFESQRTHKRAIARLREIIETECPADLDSHLCVMHGDAEVEARELAAEFSEKLGLPNVPVYELPPAVLTHAGPGPIAVSFFVKEA